MNGNGDSLGNSRPATAAGEVIGLGLQSTATEVPCVKCRKLFRTARGALQHQRQCKVIVPRVNLLLQKKKFPQCCRKFLTTMQQK